VGKVKARCGEAFQEAQRFRLLKLVLKKQLLDLLQRRMELSDFADSPAESIEQATGVIE